MSGAGIRLFAKFRGQMLKIATTGITSLQTAFKWTADCQVPRSGCRGQAKPVAIRSQILNATDCHNPWHTFERGTWQETEFQLPPFYIESPPVFFFLTNKI
jgi:hypothetical protein